MLGHRLLGAVLLLVGGAIGTAIVWIVYDRAYESQTLAITIGIPGTLIISLFALLLLLGGLGLLLAPRDTVRFTRTLRQRRPF
jgi:4-hydroxybenzoate polyprenyltransferase